MQTFFNEKRLFFWVRQKQMHREEFGKDVRTSQSSKSDICL